MSNINEVSYFIRPDTLSWVLVKRSKVKGGKNKGEYLEVNIGYYKTRKAAANAILERLTREKLSDKRLSYAQVMNIEMVVSAALEEVKEALKNSDHFDEEEYDENED